MDRFAINENLALIWDEGSRQRLDQCRLAGAIVADDGQNLSRIELEIGAIQRRDMTVALDEAMGLEYRRLPICRV